jgi:protein TonB
MNQHLLLRGVRVSLLLHGVVLCSIFYLGNLLPDVSPPLKIDFYIDNGSTDCPSGNCSENLPEPVAEKKKPRPPIKKTPPVNKPKLQEKKPETIKPKQPEPKPVKSEVPKPVLKKIVPLQTKKRMVVEEKVRVAAVEPKIEATPVQSQQKKVEPKEVELKELQTEETEPSVVLAAEKESSEPQDASAVIPAAASPSQAKAASPKEHYIKANFSFIRDTVERNLNYPAIARRMGWEGKVLVAFLIDIDGHVENIRVIKSCGFKALDKNAIKTIERCAPFPKPPLSADITLPITYKLN